MNREEALRYAEEWTANWNTRNLEAVLAHFEEGVVFTSPKALATVGFATVRGKAALLEYWTTVLRPVRSLRFSLHRVIWDPETSELSIVYDRGVDGHVDRASEVLQFGSSGKVVRGEVFYGVAPKVPASR
jgi:hypothetical protein